LEMGFDSLFLSQLGRAIEMDFGVSVTYRELTDEFNTFDKLAAHLEANAPRGTTHAAGARADAAPAYATAIARADSAPPASDALGQVLARLAVLERKLDQLNPSGAPARDVALPMSEAQHEIWLAC